MKRTLFPLLGFILIFALCLPALPLPDAQALSTGFSLRFYGHGTGDIDRVKIRIEPNVPADVGGNFTIEFWMKANLADNASPVCVPGGFNWINGNILVDRDIFGNGDYGDYGISLAGGRIAFGVGRGASNQTLCGVTNVADGNWHHIAVTRNTMTGQMRVYVDGAQDAIGTGPKSNVSYHNGRSTSYPNSDPFLVLGAEKHDAGSEFASYNGFLDELRISTSVRYSRTFIPSTQTLKADTYTAALYHFDEGPAGACSGLINDSSKTGASDGQCMFGGSATSGPEFSTDSPITPPPTTTPTKTRTPTRTATPTQTPVTDETPALILRSGFEADLTMYNVNDNILGLQGIDRSVLAPNDWAQASGDPAIGDFYFQLASPGTTADRSAFLTTDPVNPNNQVLAFQIKNATESGNPFKGRVSCNIGENNNLHEVYYKVKLFLPADIGYLTDYTFPSGNWLNLMEFWHSPDWTTPAPYPFRISLYVINSPDKQSLNFGVEAQAMDSNNWKRIWAAANTNFNLPFNEWLDMEFYYKEGNNSTGRFYMTVIQSNGQKTVLFDVTNFTHHPENPSPTGLKFINPMKLYSSKGVVDWISTHQPQNGILQVYWDDFEFWKNKNPFNEIQ